MKHKKENILLESQKDWSGGGIDLDFLPNIGCQELSKAPWEKKILNSCFVLKVVMDIIVDPNGDVDHRVGDKFFSGILSIV